jgi:hypothetical protein
MKNLKFVGLALATALATVPAAMASGTVPIYVDIWGTNTSDPLAASGVGEVALGSGTLMGVSEGGGVYDITGGSLTINGNTWTVVGNGSYPANSATAEFGYDDKLSLSASPYFVDDTGGLLFSYTGGKQAELFLDSNGDVDYNDVLSIYNNPGFSPTYNSNTGIYSGYDVGFSASLTPEPSSWLLMGTGLLFLVGFLYRKAKPGLNRAA